MKYFHGRLAKTIAALSWSCQPCHGCAWSWQFCHDLAMIMVRPWYGLFNICHHHEKPTVVRPNIYSKVNTPVWSPRGNQRWNSAVQCWFSTLENFVFSAVQRFSGNEQRWIRTETFLIQSWSAPSVSGTSTRYSNEKNFRTRAREKSFNWNQSQNFIEFSGIFLSCHQNML